MDIKKEAVAGSLESSDCLVMVRPSDLLQVDLESLVQEKYGSQILQLVEETLKELNITSGYLKINDRGALDYCLRARVKSAVKRGCD